MELGDRRKRVFGKSFLTVSVTPLSKAIPGTDPSPVRQGLLASAKADKANPEVILGVGDGAIYESDAPIRAKATALAKGNLLILTYETKDARAQKDQVIALLKTAARRL